MRAAPRYMLIGLSIAGMAATPACLAADWDGPLLKPVQREKVFEFAQRPTVVRKGPDRYEIRFASRAKCDVAVAIEDEKGWIVRHIVYGVLGSNAPAPLEPNALEQAIVWDGKDDSGAYVVQPEKCRVRVSLGLKPTFDKLLGWHPKDATSGRDIAAIAADKDGVYVLEVSCFSRLKMFDHDGTYVRTLLPYRADKVGTAELRIPTRGVEFTDRVVPKLSGLGGIAPIADVSDHHSMAAAAGRIAMFTNGEHAPRRILRLRTDGTTGGEPCVGATVRRGFRSCMGPAYIALSPDGRWAYLSGLSGGKRNPYGQSPPFCWNCVFRVPWDAKGPIIDRDPHAGERPYVGRMGIKDSGVGKEDDELNCAEGVACDASGRLYVCDFGNARIQVFDTSDVQGVGKLVKSIPFEAPRLIAVHQGTGEIYVLSFPGPDARVRSGAVTLYKLGPIEAPRPRWKQAFDVSVLQSSYLTPVMCVDSWAKPTKVWLVVKPGVVRVFADRGESIELVDDFEQDVIEAGLTPHVLGWYGRNRIEADPVRGHLYYLRGGALFRCDPQGPGKFIPVTFDGSPGWEEMDIGRNGLLYLRALKFLVRFDPDKAEVSPGEVHLSAAAEVPFDYGQEQAAPWTRRKYRGAIKIAALPGANGFDTGIGVDPKGRVVAFMKNYRTWEDMLWGRPKGKWIDTWGERNMKEALTEGYRPRRFPGRFIGGGELVMRWSSRGELVGEDLVPALPMPSCGIKSDRQGNVYLGIGANWIMPDGKSHSGGALAKFAPQGARFYGVGDTVKLHAKPARPAEFRAYGWGDLWTKNMYWAYPGLDHMHFLGGGAYACLCATCRFDMDLYGRCFVPKAYQFTVGVVDTNGNRICEIGRYGNAESGRGPASPVKIGHDEIAVADCAFVGVDSDRWLYLNDDGNGRIIRVRLGYQAQEVVRMPQEQE